MRGEDAQEAGREPEEGHYASEGEEVGTEPLLRQIPMAQFELLSVVGSTESCLFTVQSWWGAVSSSLREHCKYKQGDVLIRTVHLL
jgi:hypothetical protein